jgi:hypothetical protein
MISLDASVDDIDVNTTPGTVIVDIRVRQSKVVFRLHGFAVTDPL